jgi:hypothetical protein
LQLKDLLALKQQQAGVIEAREAVRQATETFKQGKSIMLFTVVTIVFASDLCLFYYGRYSNPVLLCFSFHFPFAPASSA